MELTSSKTLPTFAVTRRNGTGSAEFILWDGVCLFWYYAVILLDLFIEQDSPEFSLNTIVEVMYSRSFYSCL